MGLLTIREVAERLKVSEATVERLIASGELVATMVRTSIRIAPADLDAYLQASRVVRS